MKYLAAFLAQFENLESLGQGTAKTAKSPRSLPDADAEPALAPESPPGVVCDDCGQECTVTLVTDYGRRYCRRCVFPAKTRTQKGAHA